MTISRFFQVIQYSVPCESIILVIRDLTSILRTFIFTHTKIYIYFNIRTNFFYFTYIYFLFFSFIIVIIERQDVLVYGRSLRILLK